MRGKPAEIYGKSKIIVRTGKVSLTVMKIAGLNTARTVLRFASPDPAAIVVTPSASENPDEIGFPINANSQLALSFGTDGPLTQCEWFAISTDPTADLIVVEVITDCDGGGGGVEDAFFVFP